MAGLISRGQSAYASGRFEEALAAFESAIERAPDQPIPRYDAAAALFQLEQYAQALERYQEARARADAGLRTKIDFALGNTALALGDVAGAVEHYDRCLGSTASGPGLDDVRRDAAINREFAIEQAKSAMSSEGESDPDQPPTKSRNRPPGARKRGGGDEQGPDESPDGNSRSRGRWSGRRAGPPPAAGGGPAGPVAPASKPGRRGTRPMTASTPPSTRSATPSAGGSRRNLRPSPPATTARTGEPMRRAIIRKSSPQRGHTEITQRLCRTE